MTYRSGFEPIPKSVDPKAASALSFSMRIKSTLSDSAGFSSDSGWGCMIRSGQSLLATTIGILRLGRDWRRGQSQEEERHLISMFADDPRAPYSIHNFVRHGATACGKYPGEWFGPSATAQCIQALTSSSGLSLNIYSPNDGQDVYEDSFMKIAKSDGQTFNPTLILIRTRLGIDKITPIYWDALIAGLHMPQSVGIAGYVVFYFGAENAVANIPSLAAALHLLITSWVAKGVTYFTWILIIREKPFHITMM